VYTNEAVARNRGSLAVEM